MKEFHLPVCCGKDATTYKYTYIIEINVNKYFQCS